ncbi:MAG: hypothetical protein ACTSQJ_10550 [Promethearchaeota archaeon]
MQLCPICKTELKTITLRHINSKKHQEALKEAGIKTLEDPTLELIKKQNDRKEDKKNIKGEEKKEVIDQGKLEFASKEDMELEIPSIPEAPKQKKKLSLNSSEISIESLNLLEEMEKEDTTKIKVVLVNCDRCGQIIPVPVIKELVLNSELPVVPISYVHKNIDNLDPHCITIFLDHDFDIRRQRISEIIISKQILPNIK